ncbi:hypothetical protein SAMN06295885_3194 [Rathayibacter oskolensis]|uniref:CBM6 domain-containing protein n=1 Tax=Rathayibacter oskolensis TaxID=1891671 RepID=A0A1X7PF21_9MICO|nr:hypothetical protein [Rathayibacter oskolensis]SMH49031.1 hypothetical protein SAMN06295885_3194 [Rathayibacter oskolensis]
MPFPRFRASQQGRLPGRSRLGRPLALATTVALIATGAGLASPAFAADEDLITVDFASSTGTFRGGASGMLYGLSDDGVPTDAITEGAHPTNVTQKAPHGAQHPNGDPLEIEDQFFESGGQYIMTNIQDYYPDWAYNGGKRPTDFTTYLDIVRTVVTSIKTESDHPEKYIFTPFNEPDGGNWYADWGAMKDTYLADWKAVYQTIKSVYPEARIAGMGDTRWQPQRTRDILAYAKANNVLPDMFTWHELGIDNLATFRSHFDEYRQIERDLGIPTLPVNITEYAMRRDMSVPGQIVQWLAMFEDKKVDAQTAYWTFAGNLNDNMAKNNDANGAWWMLKWYADMSGNTVALTPPSLNVADTVQGIATVDTAKKEAEVVFGGGSKNVHLDLANLPTSVFGSTVDVQVREAEWTGQEGAAQSPKVVASQRVTLGSGAIDITVPNDDRLSAYQLVVTPAQAAQPVVDGTWSTSIEAENTTLANVTAYNQPMSDAWSFAASGQRDVGSTNRANSSLTWNVTVPENGTYRLGVTAGVNGTNIGPGRHALFVDGTSAGLIEYEAGFGWTYRGRAEKLLDLTAGAHQLSIRMSSDGTTLLPGSDISLDKFDLTRVSGSETVSYPANLARLDGATAQYGTAAPAGSVALSSSSTATFYVSARDAGYYDLKADYTTPGAAALKLAVNDRPVFGLSADKQGTWTSTARVHLAKGISEITVGSSAALNLAGLTTVRAADGDSRTVRIEAEDSSKVTLRGGASVSSVAQPTNVSGTQVGYLGGNASSTMEVSRPANTGAGAYDLDVRYSNAEKNTGHEYNADIITRFLDISEAGGATSRGAFRHNYSWKGYWTHTIPLDLTTSTGNLTLGNATKAAPNVDWIALSPLVTATSNVQTAQPSLKVTAKATPRCIAGKVTLTTVATNGDSIPVDITTTSAWGSKSAKSVTPGQSTTTAQTTRATSIAAGTVTVTSGAPSNRTGTITAAYPALTC